MVKINGPPLGVWDLRPLVMKWFNMKKRRFPKMDENQINVKRTQEYFRGFFPEAKLRKRKIIVSTNTIIEGDLEQANCFEHE